MAVFGTSSRFVALLLVASAAATGCAPEAAVTVTGATHQGILETLPNIKGRDGGYSARAWGRSIWVYGDTVLWNGDENGETWHHNSFSHTADDDFSDGITGFSEPLDAAGGPRYLIPPTEAEAAFNRDHAGDDCAVQPCQARYGVWPGPIVADPERDRALVFFQKIYSEPGELNFEACGYGIAVLDGPDGPARRPIVDPDSPHPTLMWLGEHHNIASGAMGHDGFVYAYNCRNALWRPCELMRAPLGDALNVNAWEYWDGDGYNPNSFAAVDVFNGKPIVSVWRDPALDTFIAVYSRPMSRCIVLRTAPAPHGPWSEEVDIIHAKAPDGGIDWIYDGLAHPELSPGDGRHVLTYSRPNGEFLGSDREVVTFTLVRR